MMKRTAFALVCLLFVLGRADGRTGHANTTDVMSEFRFLIGAWQPVTDSSKSQKYAELITYAPIHDGKFLVSQQILSDQGGEIIYKDFAVFGVDPDTHLLFLHAYNTDGSIDRTREIDSPPGQWIFLGTVYGSPNFRDYRYTMTKLDDNHIRILIELLKDGVYTKHSDAQYERKSRESRPDIQ